MKNNIKLLELENKKQKKEILNILEKAETKNIYLLEGIISENPNNKNLLFYKENRLISVVHLKLKRYAHIQCLINDQSLNMEFGTKLKATFPEIRSIFGERKSIDFFKSIYSDIVDKAMSYTFMELLKENFKPVDHYHSGISKENFKIYPESLPDIVLLQILYEIEELEIDPSKIRKEIITKMIDLRLKRSEMTVLNVEKKPIGIAAINARFKDICQIGSVYIDRAFRGKAYGTALLSEHFRKLFQLYKKLVLFVRKDNEIAYNLYKKLGFIVKGELEQIILK